MIDSEFLAELSQFTDSIERTASSMYQGEQQSPEVGEGQTFSDHRRYTPGDDIRLVDWKVLARTGDVYIKRYEAERELDVHILVDTSASMDFGDKAAGHHKFEYAAKVGLGISYMTAETHNEFRFSGFDTEVERFDRGPSDRNELLRLIDHCNRTELSGEADFPQTLRTYASRINSRSVVVVISDFLADPDEIRTGLQSLGEHEVIAVQVVAPEERDLPVSGDAIFEDLESGSSLRAYFGGRLKQRYQERLETHLTSVTASCQQTGAQHDRLDTDTDFFDAFGGLWRRLRTGRGDTIRRPA